MRGKGDQAALERYTVENAAFGHGYLLWNGASRPAEIEGWRSVKVGGFTYATHPRTVMTRVSSGPLAPPWSARHVVLLGHPVDVATASRNPTRIARRLLATLETHGRDAALREAAYLGGRLTAVLHEPRRMTVVPDTHASQPVFWSEGRGVAVGSHASLVAKALDREPDDNDMALYDGIRAIRRRGTIYMPGMSTPWQDVHPIVPNCYLEVRLELIGRPTVTHRRFWPFEERVENDDVDAVYARFRELFLEHVGLLSGFGRTAISLTAGLDSRVTLAALAGRRAKDMFAFTYAHPRNIGEQTAVAEDVYGASELAFLVGLPHRLLYWRNPENCWRQDRATVFLAAYERTWPERHGSLGSAYAMYADLPHDIIELQSNLAETGTTNSRPRTGEPITPVRLAVLWLDKRFADHPQYHRPFADFIDQAEFSAERLLGYDHHDIFYWEHRMSRWASRKFQEGDLSHRVLLPFNDRRLIETMLSLPQPLRAAKVLYTRLLDEVPHLRDVA